MSTILVNLLRLCSILLLARAILSWIQVRPGSGGDQVKQVLARITDPVLAPLRRVLPVTGGLDLSPLIALLIINFILIPLAIRL